MLRDPAKFLCLMAHYGQDEKDKENSSLKNFTKCSQTQKTQM
jgi:hypothetical protein